MTQELGWRVEGFTAPPAPSGEVLTGRYAELEKLNADRHAAELFQAFGADPSGDLWTYMAWGPFSSASSYHHWAKAAAKLKDPYFYVIRDLSTRRICGVAAYLRITPAAGVIEVGGITYAPELQRTKAATEAMYLMMKWAFEAGYRRYEWKCDALNLPSRRAAQRLGFSYEGIFRQAVIVKDRNRDTAWFACVDGEWAGLKAAYEAWLSPANFGADGQQNERLGDLTQLVRANSDPVLIAPLT